MTETQQVIALLKAIDARLARIERAMNSGPADDEPVYVGLPAPSTGLAVVIPIKGTVT